MKKIRIIYILITSLSITVQYSCNKALDLKPLDQISDASYWKSANDFQLAANKFYTYERTLAETQYNPPAGYPHNDERSDLSAHINPYSNGSNVVLQTDYYYSVDYSRIRTINYFLDKAASYQNPDEIKKYVAEAKFFRAYVYFDLLQLYGGVPIVKRVISPESDELHAARNTRDEVADFIIDDLNSAIPDLPLQAGLNAEDLGRVSRGATQSFLSRVALFEGTWQKFRSNAARGNLLLDIAINASGAVITSNEYSLFQPAELGDSAQNYLFTLENPDAQGLSNPAGLGKAANHEYILSNRYDYSLRQSGSGLSFSMDRYDATRKFINLFLCIDGLPVEQSPLFAGYATNGSEFLKRDNRLQYTAMIPGRPYWSQTKCRINWTGDSAELANAMYPSFNPNFGSGYHTQKWVSERNTLSSQEAYDYPVIRYAEVLLNYAEAVFERNDAIGDADLDKSINLVRLRVNKNNGMPKLSNALVTSNSLSMRTEIRRERSIELYQENFRTDDLKRWKTAEIEMPMPLLGIKWTSTQYETTWPEAASFPKDSKGYIIIESARSWSEKNYLLPIPTTEIQINPSIVQNPGW